METVLNPVAPWLSAGKRISENANQGLGSSMVEAGLNWSAEKIPLICEDNEQASGAFAVRRSSDNRILGTVGPRYRILQNEEAFTTFQPFLDAGEATIEAAGEFNNGVIVWILAKINRDPVEIVPGDEVNKYVLLSHSHDGRQCVRYGFTPIRIYCQNTLALAHKSSESQLMRLRHSGQMLRNLSEITAIMNLADSTFEASAEQYRWLAGRDINQKDLAKYVRKVLKVSDAQADKSKSSIEDIVRRFESGMGNDLPNIRGTWWAAYNGVVEHLAYAAGKTAERRASSLWTGANSRTNFKALQLALDMAS